MKIYTKTGDKGKTSLIDGTRVYKNDLRVEAYGTVDELNAVIGIVVSEVPSEKFKNTLIQIQNDLFEIGSNLADPKAIENEKLQKQLEKHTEDLEKYIDGLTTEMPELTYFILPGGGKVSAFLHLARTVSRRAERNIVSLAQTEHVTKEVLIYLNRLSDVFHTMSRYANFMENKQETIWVSKTK
jgi:cob(I)alamin adenosyltransferase